MSEDGGRLGSGSASGSGFKSLPRVRLLKELYLGSWTLLPLRTYTVKHVPRWRTVPKLGFWVYLAQQHPGLC